MNSFERNLDNYITGQYDPNAPFNQPDEEANLPITDLMEDKRFDEAFSKVAELRTQLMMLRDKAKVSNDTYYFNRLNRLIQLI